MLVQGSAQAAVGRSLLQLQRQRHAKAARTFTCDARCDTQVHICIISFAALSGMASRTPVPLSFG